MSLETATFGGSNRRKWRKPNHRGKLVVTILLHLVLTSVSVVVGASDGVTSVAVKCYSMLLVVLALVVG